MGKKKKLPELLKTISFESLDLIDLLEILISNSEGCRPTYTLLEIAKKKSIIVLRKIEKTRKMLNLLD